VSLEESGRFIGQQREQVWRGLAKRRVWIVLCGDFRVWIEGFNGCFPEDRERIIGREGRGSGEVDGFVFALGEPPYSCQCDGERLERGRGE
jgi:hypothetical protein